MNRAASVIPFLKAKNLLSLAAAVFLVSFRILWGIFGTHHARFTNFVRHPVEILRYARGLLTNNGLLSFSVICTAR